MSNIPWDWRDSFRSTPTGFQMTATSLNIRHFYIGELLKVRLPIKEDRWWFRFRHNRTQGLERDDVVTEFEFEFRPLRDWYLSLIGEPARHKKDSDAGIAARWGKDESRSVQVAYFWPNFDTNYAFHNPSINEGFHEFYRRLPQEGRLRTVWIRDRISLFFDGVLARPWELEHRDFRDPLSRYVSRGNRSEASLDLRGQAPPWTWSLEGEAWRNKESVEFEPIGDDSQNRALIQERSLGRISLERFFGEYWRSRVGLEGVASREVMRHPLRADLDEGYALLDRIAFVRLWRRVATRTWLESGYTYDRQSVNERYPGGQRSHYDRSQSQGRLGLQQGWSGGASLRVLAAIELDQNQAERFFSFDGGTVQFQTTF